MSNYVTFVCDRCSVEQPRQYMLGIRVYWAGGTKQGADIREEVRTWPNPALLGSEGLSMDLCDKCLVLVVRSMKPVRPVAKMPS